MTGSTYVAFVRDHSASMSSLREMAKKDYNSVLAANKKSHDDGLSTVFGAVVEFSDSVRVAQPLKPISAMEEVHRYDTPGGSTRLWDGVYAAIRELEKVPVEKGSDVAFLVLVTTDGRENDSRDIRVDSLVDKIRELTATDKWTFVFRVPHGYKRIITSMGVPSHNVIEWSQDEESMAETEVKTSGAFDSFYVGRARGITASTSFYADTEKLTASKVAAVAKDVTGDAKFFPVTRDDNDVQIRDFITKKCGRYEQGRAFYQLTKSEKVQHHKLVALREKATGRVYSGPEARKLIGLPSSGEVNLNPGSSPNYDVFVQSTSVNRKVKFGTQVLYFG